MESKAESQLPQLLQVFDNTKNQSFFCGWSNCDIQSFQWQHMSLPLTRILLINNGDAFQPMDFTSQRHFNGKKATKSPLRCSKWIQRKLQHIWTVRVCSLDKWHMLHNQQYFFVKRSSLQFTGLIKTSQSISHSDTENHESKLGHKQG